MRIANLGGRLAPLQDDRAVDVETASNGRFAADPQAIYDRWVEFTGWVAEADRSAGDPFDELALGAPAPAPSQVFAIGLNYDEHAHETGWQPPTDELLIFTKFASCLAGPFCEVGVPAGGHVDWEVELVAVIGRPGVPGPSRRRRLGPYVAGLSVGQDISERVLQLAATPPQFSFAKSYPNDWLDRSLAGHRRRVRRPGRSRAGLFGQRGDGAEGPHRGHDLLGPGTGRAAVGRRAACAGRCHLHRHPVRGRFWADPTRSGCARATSS